MVKRVGSSLLWFVSIGWGMNLLAAFAGLPELPGLVGAAAVATFVGVDPLHLFRTQMTSGEVLEFHESMAALRAAQTQV